MTRIGKKAITPKQKKVIILSSVRPARPTPSAAIAAGAATRRTSAIRAERAAIRASVRPRLTAGIYRTAAA